MTLHNSFAHVLGVCVGRSRTSLVVGKIIRTKRRYDDCSGVSKCCGVFSDLSSTRLYSHSVKKSDPKQPMIVLSDDQVWGILKKNFRAVIDINRKALGSLSADASCENGNDDASAYVPSRIMIPYNKGSNATSGDCTLFKPAMYTARQTGSEDDRDGDDTYSVTMGMKVASVRDGNANLGKPSVPCTIMMLDPASGDVSAVLGATSLTAVRTAAGSAAATELMCLSRLAPPSAGTCSSNANEGDAIENATYPPLEMVCFGAGMQIEMHIAAIRACQWPSSDQKLELSKLTIINRNQARALALKEKLLSDGSNDAKSISEIKILSTGDSEIDDAVSTADIIVTGTNASTPLFQGKMAKKGVHINGVGSYQSDHQEIDNDIVDRCYVCFDTVEAMTVGDLKHLRPSARVRLFGDIIAEGEGITSLDHFQSIDSTFFKSVGTAIQDILTAEYVVQEARKQGVGTEVIT